MLGQFTSQMSKMNFGCSSKQKKPKPKQKTIVPPKIKILNVLDRKALETTDDNTSQIHSPSHFLANFQEEEKQNLEFEEVPEPPAQQIIQEQEKINNDQIPIQYEGLSYKQHLELMKRPPNQKRITRMWTPEEDKILLDNYKKCNGKWVKIVQNMDNRNFSQCQQRFRKLNPHNSRNKKWAQSEDDQVIELVQEFGKNWNLIASKIEDRSAKQVRERYINKLDPSIKDTPWTFHEDKLIVDSFGQIGGKWSEISKQLDGRPENAVKNRFYSHLKKHFDLYKDGAIDIQDALNKYEINSSQYMVSECEADEKNNIYEEQRMYYNNNINYGQKQDPQSNIQNDSFFYNYQNIQNDKIIWNQDIYQESQMSEEDIYNLNQ